MVELFDIKMKKKKKKKKKQALQKKNERNVTISSFSIKIFVNGVLDTVFFPSPGFSEMYASPDPVYVRGHPDYLLGCRLDYSLGLLEVYGREMRKEEFETMAQGFSGDSKSVVEPGNILLGCSDCSIQQVGF